MLSYCCVEGEVAGQVPRFPSSDKRGSATTASCYFLSLVQPPAKEGGAGGRILSNLFEMKGQYDERTVKKGLLVQWKIGEVGLKLKQQRWSGPT